MLHTDVLLERASEWNDDKHADMPGRHRFYAVCIGLSALVFTLWQIHQAVHYTRRALRAFGR